jgi:Zn-dependent peptidase ImmA (M78 family)/DNA-binding XRE family transcriptional regulator
MFNATRLAVARKRRHLTKKELAGKAGISQVTLTRIETGVTPEPADETVEALARALQFPRAFFYLDDCEDLKAEEASFRSLSAMTAKQKNAALAGGVIGFALDDFVTARYNLPEPQLPDLRDEDAIAAAAALRNLWGLGSRPIPHMTKLLEAKGVRVFSLAESNKNVDAFSCWRGTTPYVFLNTFKSAERSRFDAAHELGHLVLHRHGGRGGRDVEREADQFASAFLIPRDDLKAHLPRVTSLAPIIKAKERWGVSVAALTRNAYEAELITDWHYRDLCRTMSAMGYRKSEPNPRAREASVLWQKLFQSMWNDRLTKDDVAHELCVPVEEIEALLGGLYGDIDPARPGPEAPGLRLA